MSNVRNNFGRNPITRKVKKLNPKVELTAMVSISFLLIIFFMLNSYLSRANMMDLGMPQKNGYGKIGCYFIDDRTLNVLLGENDKIVSYFGNFYYPYSGFKTHNFDKNSLGKELLLLNQQMIKESGRPERGLIVLIKPSKKSNYGNLVSILDEMAISKIRTYSIVDITEEEENLLSN